MCFSDRVKKCYIYNNIIFPYMKHIIKTIFVTSWRCSGDVAKFDSQKQAFFDMLTDVDGNTLNAFLFALMIYIEYSFFPFQICFHILTSY